mmetsp:Transcript_22149/g.48199  ORF Transcript_22149/g.48199 Transcript_22149/m.48199 type:complete len:126 (+) Transcript_22149:115-492(+)
MCEYQHKYEREREREHSITPTASIETWFIKDTTRTTTRSQNKEVEATKLPSNVVVNNSDNKQRRPLILPRDKYLRKSLQHDTVQRQRQRRFSSPCFLWRCLFLVRMPFSSARVSVAGYGTKHDII